MVEVALFEAILLGQTEERRVQKSSVQEEAMENQGYLKLIMWQKSMELVEFSYALIRMLLASESECLGS